MAKSRSRAAAAEPTPILTDDIPSAASSQSVKDPSTEGYTVLARRYRPQQFTDLVGQEPVVQALVNALTSNRVAHAYLFTGARGVGKTSTARILAKALNCVTGPTVRPCDACEICRSIASGDDVDVLEIDGASNRGIDEVREIRQNVQYRPGRARFKIYIVDEVHMLTPPAFNALLKTLEEPPPHVKFIFATTEVQRIPVTILSRCQRFDFAGIGTARIVERLRAIVAKEGMQADDEALELVARRSGGSMRDAQSLLDQLLAFGSDRLTVDHVHQMLGTAHDDRVLALASAVLAHDSKQALELLNGAADEGLQMGELVDQLIGYWRDLMVLQTAGSEARDLSVPSRHRQTLDEQARTLSLDTILAGLDVLDTTKARLRVSSHPRVLVEMALVRLGRLENLISLTDLAQWLDHSRGTEGPSAEPRGTAGAVRRPESRDSSHDIAAVRSDDASKKKSTLEAVAADSRALLTVSDDTLPAFWQAVLEKTPPLLARELARGGLPAISAPNTLVLRFPLDYNSSREYLEQPANVSRVEALLQSLTGSKWTLRFEPPSGQPMGQKAEPSANPAREQSPYRRKQAEALKEPLVRKAIERMGAQIVEVDEGFGAATAPAPQNSDDWNGEDE
jgi:DNA polymerase-3 subunit gamma/tau